MELYSNKRRECFGFKFTVSILLTVNVSCAFAYPDIHPDFSYINYSTPTTVKLINPLYLDTSKTEKAVIKVNTIKATSFDEADYFSSSIDSSPPSSLEQDRAVNTHNPSVSDEELPLQTPNSDFFTPPIISDTDKESPVKSDLIENEENEDYILSVDDTIQHEEIDIDGRIISDVEFQGLKTLTSDFVLSQIKSKIGSRLNVSVLQNDLQGIYATGFFSDKMSVEPEIENDERIKLTFLLEENILVTNVAVKGNTVISSAELTPFILPLKGLPQNIEDINRATDKLKEYYHEKGYILARVSSVDDDADGNLFFEINEGIIDKIFIEGNEKTKDYIIERNIMTQPGTVYNENYLKEDLSRVFSTKIFKDVDRKITPSDTVEGEYNVIVVVKEDSSNALNLGGGIDSGIGIFGSLSYTENNLLGRAQKLTASGMIGSGILLSDASIKNRVNYHLGLTFFEPYFLNADNSLTSRLYYRDLGSFQVPLAIERRLGWNSTIEHKVKGYNNLKTNFSAGFENISLSEGDYNKIANLYAVKNISIANRAKELTGGFFVNMAPGVKYSIVDSEENPREGIQASAKFFEALSVSDFRRNTNGRLAGSITKYLPVREKSSLALTAKGGVKVHGNELPEVMAFRLGGPYSIRGFRMSGVGTGDSFLMGSAELATPLPFSDRIKWDFFQKIRLTFFIDAGKVFDPTISSIIYDRPMSAISAGLGLKVYIPGVGPISVDYGIPLTNPGDYGSKRGYFTFGSGDTNGYGW